jgi:hypothetical protein
MAFASAFDFMVGRAIRSKARGVTQYSLLRSAASRWHCNDNGGLQIAVARATQKAQSHETRENEFHCGSKDVFPKNAAEKAGSAQNCTS